MRTRPDYDAVLENLGLADQTPAATPDMPLMDMVQGATFRDKVLGTKLNDPSKRLLMSYRIKLRQAERFILDDEAVKLICRLCHEEDRLPGWSFLARIPYPVMWVELDLHKKVKEFEDMGTLRHPFNPKEVSKTAGYLFYKETGSDTRWIAHEFKEFYGEAVPGMLAFVFDPEGHTVTPIRGSSTWNSPTLSLRPGLPKIPLVITDGSVRFETDVDPEFGLCGLLERSGGDRVIRLPVRDGDIVDESEVLKAPDWFSSRSAVIVDPFWERHITNRKKLNDVVSYEVGEQSGIMRWLITFLASINALPRAVRPAHTRVGTHLAGPLRHLAFMRHHNLTIQIPRDNRVIWAKRRLDQAALGRRMSWHSVIGHWRVIEYGKARGRICRHSPVMIENGVGMCENCEMLVRWIEIPDGRGDPTLGVIDHTYKVKTRK